VPEPVIDETTDFFSLHQEAAPTRHAEPITTMPKQESFDLLGGFNEPVNTKAASNPMPDLLGKICLVFFFICDLFCSVYYRWRHFGTVKWRTGRYIRLVRQPAH
jgi:hypothetical protein